MTITQVTPEASVSVPMAQGSGRSQLSTVASVTDQPRVSRAIFGSRRLLVVFVLPATPRGGRQKQDWQTGHDRWP